MKFLETITLLGDTILVPIDRIQYISFRYTNGWEIHIVGDDSMDLSEHFGQDEDKATFRFDRIKTIIEAG